MKDKIKIIDFSSGQIFECPQSATMEDMRAFFHSNDAASAAYRDGLRRAYEQAQAMRNDSRKSWPFR